MTAVAPDHSWRSQGYSSNAAQRKRLKKLAQEAEEREAEEGRHLQESLRADFLEREARRRAAGG